MPDANEEQKPKKRLTWRFFVLVFVGSLLLFVCSAVWWYNSDADLDAVRARALSLGMPTTYEEIYTEFNDPRLIVALDKVAQIVENDLWTIDYYYEYHGLDLPDEEFRGFSQEAFVYPGRGLDEASLTYYRKAEITECVQEVIKILKPFVGKRTYIQLVDGKPDGKSVPLYFSGFNSAACFLSDYAFAQDQERFDEIIELQLQLTSLMPREGLIGALVRVAGLGLIASAVETRFDKISLSTLEEIRRQYLEIVGELKPVMYCGFLEMFEISDEELLFSRRLGSLIYNTEVTWFDEWFAKVAFRYSRSDMLNQQIDINLILKGDVSDLKTVPIIVKKYEAEHDVQWYAEADINILPAYGGSVESIGRGLCHIEALIAIKKGEPLPNDFWGNPYKGIYKDGKFIGFYSMGEDGIDNGWEYADRLPHWLYDYIDPDAETAEE